MATIQWELSKLVPKEKVPLSEGEHILYIADAMYLPDECIYSIQFVSMSVDGESSTLKFYLKSKLSMDWNNATVGTMNSLTKAIDGPTEEGILAPGDLKGKVVKADVKLSKPREYNGEMRQYPNIYDFKPVSTMEYEMVKNAGAVELEEPQYKV